MFNLFDILTVEFGVVYVVVLVSLHFSMGVMIGHKYFQITGPRSLAVTPGVSQPKLDGL